MMRPHKLRTDDRIKDYTQVCPELGENYVRYRVDRIVGPVVYAIRMNSPGHTSGEVKTFQMSRLRPATNTVGIWEHRGI